LNENARTIAIDAVPQVACEDPNDAKLLALAKKSEAAYLITGDKELLAIKKIGLTKILSPRQFWKAVKQENE
jgi:predicted nucleic acid-binding protein